MAVDTVAGAQREFPPTRWSLVLAARAGKPARQTALNELLAMYWAPLYCYARRKGLDRDAAQDVVQGLLAQLLERDFVAQLDPAKGRLRAYLRTALNNYLVNRHAHAAAQKRGGGAPMLSLDVDSVERQIDPATPNPDAAFEREWAVQVMQRALTQLRREFESGTRRGPFAVVLAFFQPGTDPPSYATVAAAHGMSVPQLKAFLHRARARFRELVRHEVEQTVADASEVDAEIGDLFRALSG